MNRDEEKLDIWGCCEGIEPRTPRYNRPGLSEIAYRLDTHPGFLRRMLANIHLQRPPDDSSDPPLHSLTTRSKDDPSIAILDAWATVGDVLTFYQERIANEGFLRTATERGSMLQIARAIGYELKPGVAASTHLVFTVEEAPGAPELVDVPLGTRVKSIPDPGKLPQTFENIEDIQARADWNALAPRLTVPLEIGRGTTELYLKGVDTRLEPGDGILLVGDEREAPGSEGSERWDFRFLDTVETIPGENYTHVTWQRGLGSEHPLILPAANPRIFAFRQRAAIFGYNAPDTRNLGDLIDVYTEDYGQANVERWPNFLVVSANESNSIYLDAVYPKILDRSWVVLAEPNYVELYKADKVAADSRADFTLISKTTRIDPDTTENLEKFYKNRRQSVVFAQSEQLELTEAPRKGLLEGDRIELDRSVYGLESDKILMVSGKRMRALVTTDDLTLSAEDGTEKALIPEDLLQVLKVEIIWKLRNEGGFVGSVTTSSAEISLEQITVEDAIKDRIRVQVNRDGLKLRSEGDEKILKQRDVLEVVEHKLRWKLMDGDGFVGWVEVRGLRQVLEVKVLWKLKYGDGFVGSVTTSSGDISLQPLTMKYKSQNIIYVMLKRGGLKLRSKEGERDLNVGEVLKVLNAEVIRKLKNRDGFVGPIEMLSQDIVLQLSTEEDEVISEAVTLSRILHANGRTTLIFQEAMANQYDPSTVVVYANVARATHGETLEEVLGSGDGAQNNQRFELQKPPLTYVSAPTSTGTENTLKVRVNGVLWEEVPSLYGLDELSQSYIVRIDDDANATVIFGDGESGARLPTGDENITVVYRSGIGLDGEVSARSLTLLQTRPQGISEVVNPLPASGAAPPEKLSEARRNAPLAVLTLDRIVSLRDFENFARTFAGIGKAQAEPIQVEQDRKIHITIASSSGSEVDPGSELFKNLGDAIDAMRDPVQRIQEPVEVDSYQLQTFSIEASVLVDSRHLIEDVLAKLKTNLREAFSFENRDFGQSVTAAEVMKFMQEVEGVVAVDLDRLERDDDPQKGASLTTILEAKKARLDDGDILPAELLLLNPASKGVVLKS